MKRETAIRFGKPAAVFLMGFLFVGADWQTEICVLNICHGWEPYAWVFTWVQVSNWAAFDFWRLIRYIIIAVLAVWVLSKK